MLRIIDSGHRLQSPVSEEFQALPGRLLVHDCGIDIHPQSLRSFLSAIEEAEAYDFTPQVPVSHIFGLPGYPPLMSYRPEKTLTQRLIGKALSFMGSPRQAERSGRFKRLGDKARLLMGAPCQVKQVAGLTPEETAYYFADHYANLAPKPIQLSVVVSNHCNLACVMCPYHGEPSKKKHQTRYFFEKQYMPWELMRNIAIQAGELAIPVKLGNIEEPLTHRRIIDFIALARKAGAPSAHITTNGTLLTPDISQGLLEAGLTSLYVSLDAAYEQSYALIRGGELAQVERNLRSFLDLRKKAGFQCTVMVSFVRNRDVTKDEEWAFVDKWLPNTDGAIFYELSENKDSGTFFFGKINKIASNKIKEHGRWPCLNPFQEIYILPDGSCCYCCETIGRMGYRKLDSMGNFPEQSLLEIWRGKPFTDLRRMLLANDLPDGHGCKTCNIWMAHAIEQEEFPHSRVVRNVITEIFYPVRN